MNEKRILNTNPNKVPLDLIIQWHNKSIKIGKFRFSTNGSFYFSSSQFDNKSIKTGAALLQESRYKATSIDKYYQTRKGFHFSLHPPDAKHQHGVMQLKTTNQGELIDKIELDSFPVNSSFKLFSFFTLPLDLCKTSISNGKLFETPVDNNYKDSLEIIVDILPIRENLAVVPQYGSDLWNFIGFSLNKYAVSIRLILANQRVVPQMYYPVKDE